MTQFVFEHQGQEYPVTGENGESVMITAARHECQASMRIVAAAAAAPLATCIYPVTRGSPGERH